MSGKAANTGNVSVIKRVAVIAAVLAVIFIVLLIVASRFGNMPFSGMGTRLAEKLGSGSSDAFPVRLDDTEEYSAGITGKGFYVLTDHNIRLYASDGELLVTHSFVFELPAVTVLGNELLVYDRGGTGFFIINGTSVSKEHTADDSIITAALGSRGNYALSIRSDSATSTLCMFNKANEPAFIWNCAYEHIVSIDLAGDGKHIAALSVGAENGDAVSVLHVFSFEYTDELYSYSFPGITALKVMYLTNKRILIMTDAGLYICEDQAEPVVLKACYASELDCFSFAQNGVFAQTLTKYGGSNMCELSAYDKNGEELFTVSPGSTALSLHTNGKYIFLLAESGIMVYNLKGELVGSSTPEFEAATVFGNGSYVFSCTLGGICRDYAVNNAQ